MVPTCQGPVTLRGPLCYAWGMKKSFEQWQQDAKHAAFEGWDFSYLADRWWEEPCPWDYGLLVDGSLRKAGSVLDMGTGGGEFLSRFGDQLPPHSYATEAYPPNVTIARGALSRFGVEVFEIQVHDLYRIPVQDAVYRLPVADGSLDLVINRHESFDPVEVARALRPGGRFLTQQVGGQNYRGLNRRLGAPTTFSDWSLATAQSQTEAAGLRIVRAETATTAAGFRDIGALIYYLNAVPWQVPDFSVQRYEHALRHLHQEMSEQGPLIMESHRFLLIAELPL